jgi:hypothetical protein
MRLPLLRSSPNLALSWIGGTPRPSAARSKTRSSRAFTLGSLPRGIAPLVSAPFASARNSSPACFAAATFAVSTCAAAAVLQTAISAAATERKQPCTKITSRPM